jgi:hypothetical protein
VALEPSGCADARALHLPRCGNRQVFCRFCLCQFPEPPRLHVAKTEPRALLFSPDLDASYIRGYLTETERLVAAAHAAGNTKLSIVPFTWQRYSHAPPGNSSPFLDLQHLQAEFEVPFEFPHVEAVLVWGDPAVGHVTVEQINAAFANPATGLRQLIQTVATKKCDCAKTMCGGNGRCYGVGGYASCHCFDGYSGPNCTKQTSALSTTGETEQRSAGAAQGANANAHLARASPHGVGLDSVGWLDADGSGGDRVVCPDAISSCAAGQTCGQFVGGRWGCCPLAKAVLCGDSQHCCPAGYSCDKLAGVCYK